MLAKILFPPAIFFIFLFSGCSPITGSSFLYSSSSLEDDSRQFFQTDTSQIAGLQQENLERLFDSVSCEDFRSHVWSYIYLTLFDNPPPPPPPLVQKEIKSFASGYLVNRGASSKTVRKTAQIFSQIYQQSFDFFSDKPEALIMEELAIIDLMNEDSYQDLSIDNFIKNISPLFLRLQETISPLNLACEVTKPSYVSFNDSLSLKNSSLHPLVYGARVVMAVAYQSCGVLDLPLVSSKTKNIKGVQITSRHKSGGVHRRISSLPQLTSSHYYLKELKGKTPAHGCPNILKNPLIYDFGGKPFVSSHPYPQINLFRNAGSGSSVLGMDCSGFVLSALARAGLRVKKNKPMKGSYVSGISSWLLRDRSNGLNCLSKISFLDRNPLRAGDIIASHGHVVIVDQVGQDPFGLKEIKSKTRCSALSENHFNFSIIQSSSEFNGMGINRIHIKNVTHPQLIRGLKQMASELCYQKWGLNRGKKSISDITISRHTLEPECLDPQIPVSGEECLSECSL